MNDKNLQLATFGGGCFWCLEAVFQRLRGVHTVKSGYAGGHTDNPNYKDVCAGITGHAEVIQIGYDPAEISFADLLEVFWTTHDPTTLNRQGGDVGTQYRSIILYHNEEQKAIAEASIKETDKTNLWANPIVTTLEPMTVFYGSEKYHDNYFNNNSYQPYCMFVVSPKVKKLQKNFRDKLK